VVTRLGEKSQVPRNALVAGVTERLASFAATLKERAEAHVRTRIRVSRSMDEVLAAVEDGVTLVPWCGSRECADLIEEKTRAAVLGTDVRSMYLVDASGPCVACGKQGITALVGRSY